MTRPIHIIKSYLTRDVPEAVEWTDICHDKTPCWVVNCSPRRPDGYWGSVERKRPWMVYCCNKGPSLMTPWSTHTSLKLALAQIKKAERELT